METAREGTGRGVPAGRRTNSPRTVSPASTFAARGDTPPRRRPPGRQHTARWLWALPPTAALGLAFIYPLALVVQQSFTPDTGGHNLSAYTHVFASPGFREALWTTIWIAVGSTTGCLVLGFTLALVIAFVPFPGGKALSRFIDIFLAFPSFLITLALLFVYGTVGMANGLWTDVTGATGASGGGPVDFLHTPRGVLLAEITYFTPFVMRPLLAAFSQVDTAQIEAASSMGAKAPRIVRQVILPEALPSLAAGGSLVLVMCLNEFGIVLFTGAKDVTTLPMLVYSKAILESDYTGACVVAVVNIVLSVALYGLYRVVVARTAAGGRRAGA
ncbi:2-aminoethylphosphonate ABC transporter permease subunit [Streptomyces sp. H10-C2]|uniref:2-aminoethylphosphonate ABC transporter permease subunit n=1 Tax=unclassified Streptomyces TaxID=2593676 RepID=UPI0024BB8426|nr:MULTISPECIES: 2-aminoethylphosphonate ABC transporter permease subunit [unclassified Streptomyces]MDJ0339966.1 2-aminoethylphosphonate ABC transporter permease subunit [Streptomyces sp. PH10-H1]MDJ0369397.1 2-aminoethylphosphonate ABC transporter permease subunit [Streptomyces sp. H10-C2]